MGDNNITDQRGLTVEKIGLWALNFVLVALMVWNFQRTEEATRKMDVTTAILERIESQLGEASRDRYTSLDAKRDWLNQDRINRQHEEDIKELERLIYEIRSEKRPNAAYP